MTTEQAIVYLEFLKVVRSSITTKEQVVKHFEFLNEAGLLDTNPNQVDNDALDLAIKALKKQETEE